VIVLPIGSAQISVRDPRYVTPSVRDTVPLEHRAVPTSAARRKALLPAPHSSKPAAKIPAALIAAALACRHTRLSEPLPITGINASAIDASAIDT
jgi:hypothetical protein